MFDTQPEDNAIFLPAISSFYATYIGKQRFEEYVPPSRMPAGIPEMEMLNFLNKDKGLFTYPWALYSAGHAHLDLNKHVPREDMIRSRGKHTTLLADSGGFQIAKGVWEADWKNMDATAQKYRSTVLKWLCQISDYSMTLDVPTWITQNPDAVAKTNIHTYDDAVAVTKSNHHYFMDNATNNAKFLNVLQGSNRADADKWYEEMKEFNDPTKYDNFFRGWAMGGRNMADPELALYRVVTLIRDGLLEEGQHDWMHFLGTSKLEWAVLLTAIQRGVRETHNPNFTVSFDCASPFLATANGQLYHQLLVEPHQPWSYRMNPTLDDKSYANSTMKFSDACKKEGLVTVFEESPISERLTAGDICVYGKGDLNKIGKEGKTSWDSFSYALMMAHNVWFHINAVQEANRRADAGVLAKSLRDNNGHTVPGIVKEIFAEPDYDKRVQIIEKYHSVWAKFPGARGMKSKVDASAMADEHGLGKVARLEKAPKEKPKPIDLFK